MTGEEAIQRIRQLTTPEELYTFWRAVRSGTTEPDWGEGRAFEYLILRAFELEGAEVVWPYEVRQNGVQLEQIDGVVYMENLSCLVEAKAYEGLVNYEPIAKLRGQLQRRPQFIFGAVFAMSGFTEPAKQLTRMTIPQSVLLWDRTQDSLRPNTSRTRRTQHPGVMGMRRALREKLRAAIERAVPDRDIREIFRP
jgi:hypothetical protein